MIGNQRGYQRTVFTIGLVHTGTMAQDFFIAGGQNLPRGIQEGLIGCPFQDYTREIESQRSPQSPEGPQVELEVLVAKHT